jgi:hypothetical protein
MTQALLFVSTAIFGLAFACLLVSWFRSSPWARAGNYFLDFYGCLASNPLAQEVADFVQAERERQRQLAQAESEENI